MNACIIAYTFYEVDFRVRRYVDALVGAGYHVDVFALGREGQDRKETICGVNIYHLQGREYNEKGIKSFLFRMALFFGKVFFAILVKQIKYRYRIVHVHNPPDFLVFSALVPKMLGAKIIFDMHENLPELYCGKFNKDPDTFSARVLRFFEKRAARFADFTIVAHDLLRERVIKRDGIFEEKCVALLNYPTKTVFKPGLQRKDKEEFRIIYPGTISHHQGIDIAIRAMRIVKEECKSAKLDIYGSHRNPKYFQELIKLVEDLNLNGTVSFHGVVPFEDLQNILLGASIGVVPKRGGIFGSEAFSTKILEFMVAGLPVVVSKTKIDEYYFDSSMVMFFEAENHVDLARCILELYLNAQKRETLARKGSEFIEKNNWEVKREIYLNIVNRLVGKEGTRK